jgi:LmbE family N-acetylglucosaminyl deacetylase
MMKATIKKGSFMPAGLEDLFGNQPPGEPDEAKGELRRALVVAAHPDDADFGAGGTAALLTRAGWQVRYLVATDGSKGSDDPAYTPERLVSTREEEQRIAAAHLGVQGVGFLGFTDGELEYSRALLDAITREIRAFRPYAVYTHDPEPVVLDEGFINHSDHRLTGLATVDAVYPTARDRLNFAEHIEAGLEPHKVRELFLWGTNKPNCDVDITSVADAKVEALLLHESQFGGGDDFIEFVRERWRDAAGRMVERFRRVVLFG